MTDLIGEALTCHNSGCDIVFVKKTHNQLYHDDECCRLATNAKIMEKYYAKRARHLGLERTCSSCDTKLSRYNSDVICNSCSLEARVNKTQSVMDMLLDVSWQN